MHTRALGLQNEANSVGCAFAVKELAKRKVRRPNEKTPKKTTGDRRSVNSRRSSALSSVAPLALNRSSHTHVNRFGS